MADSSIQSASTNRVITVAGGNLFAIAAQYLGDATKWYQIAQANGLRDPVIVGLQTLIIPQTSIASNGGILGY
ncbi:LysM peptidoglycan-binding domain-containing protein [Rhizobium rhizogenes]|uniref:LysM peptidoglycan-binding domain-containing protein n=1 Tax=Rhizobium rhizogenes TaxID=359 RepID=UPI0015716E3D|nr:LysM peptidoglycan-binding domain-containing protein [Rhizobium rhizogenes]NTF67978.1 LysM peptidoglycan-binding domain-containing protein [Rhizobium rhizogenes]NTG73307.1 LysM peptidoglycan-binding domain-containing protein [Rhizobium rhizogenes]